jgi:hypothetical protein
MDRLNQLNAFSTVDPISVLKSFHANKEQNRIIIDRQGNVRIASTSVLKVDEKVASRFGDWRKQRFTYEVLKSLRDRITKPNDPSKSENLQVNEAVNNILKKSKRKAFLNDIQFCNEVVYDLPKIFANSVGLQSEYNVQEVEFINFLNLRTPGSREIDFRRYAIESKLIKVYMNGKLIVDPGTQIGTLYTKEFLTTMCIHLRMPEHEREKLSHLFEESEIPFENRMKVLFSSNHILEAKLGRFLTGTSQMGLITLAETLTKVLGLEGSNATVRKEEIINPVTQEVIKPISIDIDLTTTEATVVHKVLFTTNNSPDLIIKGKLVVTMDLSEFTWKKSRIYFEMDSDCVGFPHYNEKLLASSYHPDTKSGYFTFGKIQENPLYHFNQTPKKILKNAERRQRKQEKQEAIGLALKNAKPNPLFRSAKSPTQILDEDAKRQKAKLVSSTDSK